MPAAKNLGGTFAFLGSSITVHRFGYGAMQLAGTNVFGPPKNMEAAIGVLRAVVEAGVDHIDTSDVYTVLTLRTRSSKTLFTPIHKI